MPKKPVNFVTVGFFPLSRLHKGFIGILYIQRIVPPFLHKRDPCVLQRHDAFWCPNGWRWNRGQNAAKVGPEIFAQLDVEDFSWMSHVHASKCVGKCINLYRITLFNVLFGESHGGGNKNIISLVGWTWLKFSFVTRSVLPDPQGFRKWPWLVNKKTRQVISIIVFRKPMHKYTASLKLTWHLKMDGWNTSFLLGWPTFRGYVSFREGKHEVSVPSQTLRIYEIWDF